MGGGLYGLGLLRRKKERVSRRGMGAVEMVICQRWSRTSKQSDFGNDALVMMFFNTPDLRYDEFLIFDAKTATCLLCSMPIRCLFARL